MLVLRRPNKSDLENIQKAVRAVKDCPSPFDICVCKKLEEALSEGMDAYLEKDERAHLGIGLKEGFVPNTVLFLMEGERFIGLFDVRHRLTDFLLKRGGHIAYEIFPAYRRKGYCKAGLKLCLKWMFENLGTERALLSCHADNEGSYRTMLSVMKEVGGLEDSPTEVDGHAEKRVWINTTF